MKLVLDTLGSDALERPGYLFYHASALQYESCNFEQDSTKYPSLSLSDAELDQLKLKSVDPQDLTQLIGFSTGKLSTLYYQSFQFPKEPSEKSLTDEVEAVVGKIRVRKPEIKPVKLSEQAIDDLASMVAAMIKL